MQNSNSAKNILFLVILILNLNHLIIAQENNIDLFFNADTTQITLTSEQTKALNNIRNRITTSEFTLVYINDINILRDEQTINLSLQNEIYKFTRRSISFLNSSDFIWQGSNSDSIYAILTVLKGNITGTVRIEKEIYKMNRLNLVFMQL